MKQKSWPKRLRDFRGREQELRVRTRREVRGYSMVIPAGTIGMVRAGSMWDRLDFTAAACGHCGVQMRRQCHVDALELIDADGNPLP